MNVRSMRPSDAKDVLRLNHESVASLSPLDEARLSELLAMADLSLVTVGDDDSVTGFLLAFANGRAYDSENYRWFAQRYERFLYIDRVVVDSRHRAEGFGRALYEHALAFARSQGFDWLVCEIDLAPPNPGSIAFHDRFGFTEVGQQRYGKQQKLVSMRARRVVD